MKYSTFRAFMDAQPESIKNDCYDAPMYFDAILFKGTKYDALFLAKYFGHICLDKIRTDDSRLIQIVSRKNGMIEMQGIDYE